MHEQMLLRNDFNNFLRCWGLKAVYVAEKTKINPRVIYPFKVGRALLSNRQADSLRLFMADYEARMSMGGEFVEQI